MKWIVAIFAVPILLAGIFLLMNKDQAADAPAAQPDPQMVTVESAPVVIGTTPADLPAATEVLPQPATPEPPEPAAPEAPETNESVEDLSGILEDPKTPKAVSDMQRRLLARMLSSSYGPLLAKLELDPETRKEFERLLVERGMVETTYVKQFFKVRSPADQARFMAAIHAREAVVDQQVRELLGDADYATYEVYSETVGIRGQLARVEDVVNATGDPLDDEQREDLVAHFHVTMEKYYGEDYQYTGETFRRLVAGESPDKVIADLGRMNEELLATAKRVLRPDQYDAYAKFRARRAAGDAQHVEDMVETFLEATKNLAVPTPAKQ